MKENVSGCFFLQCTN